MDRRRRRMERTRAALLNAGITIFFERGVHLTRLATVLSDLAMTSSNG